MVEKKADGNLAVSGRIDTSNAAEFEEQLLATCTPGEKVFIDAQDLKYISSAGLRVLLSAHKKMDAKGGKMKLININEMVREVLEVTGFMSVLTVE